MTKLFSVLMLLFFAGSAQAHSLEKRKMEDPDPCLHLAIPYDFCLQTIGKERWERQVKNAPPTLESRIKQLEKQLKELQKRLDSKTS